MGLHFKPCHCSVLLDPSERGTSAAFCTPPRETPSLFLPLAQGHGEHYDPLVPMRRSPPQQSPCAQGPQQALSVGSAK